MQMTNVTVHERPGVYSAFDASSVVSAARGVGTVGLAAPAAAGTANEVVTLYSFAEGIAAFGEGEAMDTLLEVLYANGAGEVKAVRVSLEDYASAFAALEECEDVDVVVCASAELAVHQALKESVERASGERRERIAVVGFGGGVSEAVEHAESLNSERTVLVTGKLSAESVAPALAAAAAAVIAGGSDPSKPLNGETLRGADAVTGRYSDAEIDALVKGGVTPVEALGGEVSIVRAVTTRTKTEDAADATWRELTTIRIVDDVIPTIRNALKARFLRSKNNARTRSAVRSQVIVELENFLALERIDSYGEVSVTALESDPTVCLVAFDFAVAHGLSRIYLTAHITV